MPVRIFDTVLGMPDGTQIERRVAMPSPVEVIDAARKATLGSAGRGGRGFNTATPFGLNPLSAPRQGAFGPFAGNTGGGSPSVIMQQEQRTSHNPSRDPAMGAPFAGVADNAQTVAQMGPGQPAQTFPLGGEPRQYQYPVGYNFPTPPDSDRGIDSYLLRTLADSLFVLRRAIERRKTEFASLKWDIVPKERNHRLSRMMAEQHAELIRAIREWIEYPEGYYTFRKRITSVPGSPSTTQGKWIREGKVEWGDWIKACLEDVFVGDWLSIWPQRTLGGMLVALSRVDGSHIKPILGLDGRAPNPPEPSYQYYLYGAPRASYTLNELYYWIYNVRNWTPYGFSNVEQSLMLINMALHYDFWNNATFSTNDIPMMLLEAPSGVSPDQLETVTKFLNGAVQGNVAARQRAWPVPFGSKPHQLKIQEFSPEYAYYLIELICLSVDTLPQELGFPPSHGGLGGNNWAAEQSGQAAQNRMAFAAWFARKMTTLIRRYWGDMGAHELEFVFTDLLRDEEVEKYKAVQVAVLSGQKSLDEVAQDSGGDAPGIGRILETKSGLLLVDKHLIVTGRGTYSIDSPTPQLGESANEPASRQNAESRRNNGGRKEDDDDDGEEEGNDGESSQPKENASDQRAERQQVGHPAKKAAMDDLSAWRRRALNDIKRGRNPARAFTSEAIPEVLVKSVVVQMHEILESYDEELHPRAVKALFTAAERVLDKVFDEGAPVGGDQSCA